MEISAEKTKLMTNSANGIQRETKVKGHSSTMEQLFQMMSPNQKIAHATAAFTKVKPIWRDNNISLGSKVKLMC